MQKAATVLTRPWEGLAELGHRISHGLATLELAQRVRRERRMLLALDDHALKDLGISRGDACAEASRPFWDLPVDRLQK